VSSVYGSIAAMKDPADFRQCAGYIRVSTEEQNLDLQISLIRAQNTGRIYSDKESGTNSARGAYTELCKEIERNLIKEVIVYRLDRLGRDPVELIRFFDILDKHDVNFVSLTEPWLTDWNKGPMQFLTWWLQIGMARFELLLLKDRQKRGISAKIEKVKKGLDTWQGRGKDKKPRKA